MEEVGPCHHLGCLRNSLGTTTATVSAPRQLVGADGPERHPIRRTLGIVAQVEATPPAGDRAVVGTVRREAARVAAARLGTRDGTTVPRGVLGEATHGEDGGHVAVGAGRLRVALQ